MEATDHRFRVELACLVGVDGAVFLHDIYFWVCRNRSRGKNRFEGRYWTYNSAAAFCQVHPYWTPRQMERIIRTCREKGLLLVGCFNRDPRDRTRWYTLSDRALELLGDGAPEGELRFTHGGDTSHQTGRALPDNKPDHKPDHKPGHRKKPRPERGRVQVIDGEEVLIYDG